MKTDLALNGGTPVWTRGFPHWPAFDRRTAAKVQAVVRSGRVNYWSGPEGRAFEEEWSRWLGVPHSVSVVNGTAALHVALAALGIGAGDEVLCTAYSFIASSFCALQCGALPVFVDVGTDHLLDPAQLEAALTPRTKAIVVVHLYGMVADMGPILAFARAHGLKVVEDCAQCIGGEWCGRKVGSIGDVGCFSFCHTKHFTTGGEGGMISCRDENLAWVMRSLRDNGQDIQAKLNLAKDEDERNYVHRRIGWNFRMTELQSAIGRLELARLDDWNLPRRRRLAEALVKGLADHPLVRYAPVDTPERRASFWLVPFVLDEAKLSVPVKAFFAALKAEGVAAYRVFWPRMYRSEAFAARHGFGEANRPFDDPANRPIDYTAVSCPMADAMATATIGFWVHPVYTLRHMAADIRAFRKVAAAFAT